MKKKFLSHNLLFVFLLFLGFIPIVCSLSFLYLKEEKICECKTVLQREKLNLITLIQRNKSNLEVHKKAKTSNFLYMKDLYPFKFSETFCEKYPFFKESELKQEKPLELSLKDLKRFLEKIESSKNPQFVILDFSIERVLSLEEEDKFKVNCKLLKREFL